MQRKKTKSVWMYPVITALITALIVTGCGIFVQPSTPADINAYNAKMFELVSQIVVPFVTPLLVILGTLGLWIRAALVERNNSKKIDEATDRLAEASKERNARVLEKVEENTEISRCAFKEANGVNEKILAVQKQVEHHVRRSGSRSTDSEDHVVRAELVSGAGVDKALKVEQER